MKEMKKAKPIVIKDTENNSTYTLEFSRKTVYFAEQMGFSIEDLKTKPFSGVSELWYYAFRKNHQFVDRKLTDSLLDELGGVLHLPEGLLERLVELYQAPFDVLAEDEDGARKNARVTVDF